MKKLIASVLILVCMLSLPGCFTTDEMYGKPVFETENITRITFDTDRRGGGTFEVPSEHMAEITSWLGSFTIGPKLVGEVPAGFYDSVKIEYTDGKVIENSLDIVSVDGVLYYTEHEEQPQWFLEMLAQIA